MGKTSIVGLDVRLSVATYLTETLGPRFTPPPLLTEMVQRVSSGARRVKAFIRGEPDGCW
jgi:3-hydroxybutyryl-CoA dehydrogenase